MWYHRPLMTPEKTTSLKLKQVPKEVHDILLDYQVCIKKKCHAKSVSLETTIYKIIRKAKQLDLKLYE